VGKAIAPGDEEIARTVEVIVGDLFNPTEVFELSQCLSEDSTVKNAGVSLQDGCCKMAWRLPKSLIAVNMSSPALLSIATARAFA
jgi:short-subunit dehydrogenase